MCAQLSVFGRVLEELHDLGKLLLGLSASVYSMTKLMFTAGMVPFYEPADTTASKKVAQDSPASESAKKP